MWLLNFGASHGPEPFNRETPGRPARRPDQSPFATATNRWMSSICFWPCLSRMAVWLLPSCLRLVLTSRAYTANWMRNSPGFPRFLPPRARPIRSTLQGACRASSPRPRTRPNGSRMNISPIEHVLLAVSEDFRSRRAHSQGVRHHQRPVDESPPRGAGQPASHLPNSGNHLPGAGALWTGFNQAGLR